MTIQENPADAAFPTPYPTPFANSPQTSPYRDTSNAPTAAISNRKRDIGKVDEEFTNLTRTTRTGCTCLQQNAELLCSFKLAECTENQDACRIDTVLRDSQEALNPWQNLVECPNCAFNQDQEVLQIAFMTIRIVLLRFQNLVPSCSIPHGNHKGSTNVSQRWQEEVEDNWQKYGACVTIGSYKVSDSDNKVVVQVLLLSTIRTMKSVLVRFKEMLDRKQGLLQTKSESTGGGRAQKQTKNGVLGQRNPASSLDHIQHMLQDLGSFLQTLERSLEQERSDRSISCK